MNFKSEILDIPESSRDSVPCQVQPELYTTKDLDIEFDENDAMDAETRKQRLAAKAAAEKKAVEACFSCVMLNECREWALGTDVFGVAGGMTQRERNKAKRASQSQKLATSSVLNLESKTKAKKPINFEQVSSETLAVYKCLSDGKQHTRDSVVDAAKSSVSKKLALQFAKTQDANSKKKVENGSRRLLLNRIDIAIRRGRIVSQKIDDIIMLSLSPEVSQEYRDWVASK